MRAFDVSDLDRARVATELDDFKRALRTLFVDGYVVCDPSSDAPPPCVDAGGQPRSVNKTLSQIAMEGIERPLTLTYSAGAGK